MIFSVLFLGEKVSKLKLVSIVCMLAGCCLVSGMIGGLKFNVAGILIGVLSGISYAAYNILTKIAMRRGFTAVTATMYSFVFMAVIALSFSSPIDIVYAAKNDPLPLIPMLIALGIVTHVLPYLFYTLSMKSLPVGTVSALGIVEPMAATIFSVILFKEKLDIFSASGIILILAAVFLLAKAEDTAEE
jgi:drug/metabolite transporter (DMT)-like permease